MLAGFFFRETRVLAMVVLMVIISGVAALWGLARQEDPTITNRYASVITALPGAEPALVEALVSTVLEGEIKLLQNVQSYSSSSLRGVSVVSVSAADTVSDADLRQLWSDLQAAVDRARPMLPEGASEPQIDTDDVTAYTTVIAVEMKDPAISPMVAARFAQGLEARLRGIPQTRVVRLYGLPQEEVVVAVDPYLASADGVSVGEVAAAINAANDPALAGRLLSDGLDADLVMTQQSGQVSDLREISVRTLPDGSLLRVADVAEVTRQIRSPPEMLARSNGHPAVLVAAVVQDGAQVDRWMRLVHEDVEEIRQDMPRGLDVEIVFDQSLYTIERLLDVGKNLLFGMVLVLLVLYFTLGARAAVIVGVILPLVSLATLATFRYIEMPLHQMSLVGLIVALGLVVDAAIVTTDNVRRRLGAGEQREGAASNAAQRLFLPLAASTVTTILTFLPMILLPGNVGDFVRTIAIAVSIMLFWSFVLAIVLTAPLAARLLPADSTAPLGAKGLDRARNTIRFLIARPFLSIGLSLILPALGFLLLFQMPSQFFPLAERNQFYLSVALPSHANVRRTDALVEQLDDYLGTIDGIAHRYWVSGGSAPAFYYNIVGGSAAFPSFAQGMITTDTPARARDILEGLQQDLTNRFPEARISVRVLSQGPPVGAPVSFQIYGSDLAELRRIGAQIEQAVAPLAQVAEISGGLTDGVPQLRFAVDRDAATLLGLDEARIADQLRAGLSGVVAHYMMEGSRRLPVRVQFPERIQEDIELISDLPILLDGARSGATGTPTVPLSALAQPRLEVADTLIYRSKGERMNYVQVYPARDVLPSTVFAAARAAIAEADIILPAGYRIETGGEARERSATVDGLLSSVALIALLGVATLVITFRSFRLTFGTLVVAGLSAGLSLLSVAAMGYPFGINALIGVIGSIGVSVNASIIIFTALQQNEAAMSGDLDAMTAEVVDGARHIISTTLTTFGGFLPLLFQGGLFWPPFAAAVAGGVLLSATLAFLFAPAYFRLLYARRAQAVTEAPGAAAAQPPPAAQYQLGLERRFARRPKHPLRSRRDARSYAAGENAESKLL